MLTSHQNDNTNDSNSVHRDYDLGSPGVHSLHECRSADEFNLKFAATVGFTPEQIANMYVVADAPRAIFLVGSIPLGMATSGSDVDFIVMVDGGDSLQADSLRIHNNDQQVAFAGAGDSLVRASFLRMINGVTVEVQVALAPRIRATLKRLRNKGPQLSEREIMTLSRLGTGWLLVQSGDYVQQWEISRADPALDVYCCTRYFVTALNLRQKALRAMEFADVTLVLHLARLSVESCFMAYFASEGLSYLGPRWIAQLGYARGATERLARHPLLSVGIRLLFPRHELSLDEAGDHLQSASAFLTAMRGVITGKMLYRIAFHACPQIYSLD
jgi:hypothetical protein